MDDLTNQYLWNLFCKRQNLEDSLSVSYTEQKEQELASVNKEINHYMSGAEGI